MPSILDNLKTVAESAVSTAGKAAGQAMEKGKETLERAAIERRLKLVQQNLGDAYYRFKVTGKGDEKRLEQYIREIDMLKRALHGTGVEHTAPELNVHLCGSCGAEVKQDAMFCSSCGESFT